MLLQTTIILCTYFLDRYCELEFLTTYIYIYKYIILQNLKRIMKYILELSCCRSTRSFSKKKFKS